MKEYGFSVIGGDTRLVCLADLLCRDGHYVKTFLSDHSEKENTQPVIRCFDAETALNATDICLLGMPCSKDGTHLFAPGAKSSFPLEFLFEYLPGKLLFAGKFPVGIPTPCPVFDYAEDPVLLEKNAILTAEGALKILSEELPVPIRNAECALTGYGRIARALAHLLQKNGANVTIFARSEKARKQAKDAGFSAFPISLLGEKISGFSALINTVPAPIIRPEALQMACAALFCMELASPPGGFTDPPPRLYKAAGVPGKFAPDRAAAVILEAIYKKLEEHYV